MIRPKVPVNPLPTGLVTPLIHPAADLDTRHAGSTPACGCDRTPAPAPVQSRVPAVRLTPAGLVTAAAAGTGAVLVIGTVLVSMLLAVAITGASVAVCAVVLRSLLNAPNTRR
ncbi:SpdD-like protein [Streptomyces xanthophaeus]